MSDDLAGFEQIELTRLARAFGVSLAKAQEAQGIIGYMYRRPAALAARQDGAGEARPEQPTTPEAMKIAHDWYTYGFQAGMNAMRARRLEQ